MQWAHQIGSAGNESQKQVIDRDGNIIVTGHFENSVSIGGFTLTSMNQSDVFLYKTKPDGKVLWVKHFGGPVYGGDVGVDTDADGNIYVAGASFEKLYFEGVLKLTATPNNHYWNSFLSKLDSEGNMIWTKGLLGTTELSEVRVWGISVNQNSIAVAGNYGTSITIDGQCCPSPIGFPGNNLFIAKFDLDGNVSWLKNPPSERTLNAGKYSSTTLVTYT